MKCINLLTPSSALALFLWVEGTHYKQYFQSEEKETMA
jgi:hypothetical protein